MQVASCGKSCNVRSGLGELRNPLKYVISSFPNVFSQLGLSGGSDLGRKDRME